MFFALGPEKFAVHESCGCTSGSGVFSWLAAPEDGRAPDGRGPDGSSLDNFCFPFGWSALNLRCDRRHLPNRTRRGDEGLQELCGLYREDAGRISSAAGGVAEESDQRL